MTPPTRQARFPIAIARLAFGGMSLLFAVWLATWTLWIGALWWTIVGGLVGAARWRVLALWTPTGLIAAPWTLVAYDHRVDTLTATLDRDGPDGLGTHDLVAIYGLHLAMATAGGLLGFPEVAAETLGLLAGADTRTWSHPTFPLCVPKVAHAVQAARAHPGAVERRLIWSYTADESFRGGLALTPSTLVVHTTPAGTTVEATVPIDYPERYRLVFGELGPFRASVEEGLFDALEQRGWLQPYTLTWTTHLAPRAPLPSTCEAWSVRLFRAIRR